MDKEEIARRIDVMTQEIVPALRDFSNIPLNSESEARVYMLIVNEIKRIDLKLYGQVSPEIVVDLEQNSITIEFSRIH